MTMQSLSLLPALQELPGGEQGQNRSFRDHLTGLVNMDRAMYAAEFTSAVSFGLWYIFDERSVVGISIPGTGINIDDDLRETMIRAHELAFPSETRTVWEHFQDALNNPGALDNTFMSPFKGKVAELETNQLLESDGWTHMTLAPDLSHPIWDNIGINPDGNVAVVQTKIGESYSAKDVQDWVAEDHPNLYEQVYADVQNWVTDREIMEEYPELSTIAER